MPHAATEDFFTPRTRSKSSTCARAAASREKSALLAPLAQRLPAGRIVHQFHRLAAPVQQTIHGVRAENESVTFTPRLLPIAHELKETRTLRGKRDGPQEHRPSQPDRFRLDRSRNQKHIGSRQCLARKSVVDFMHMGKASPVLALRNFKRRNVSWIDRPGQDDAHVVGEKTIQSREENIQTLAAATLRECYEELRVAAPPAIPTDSRNEARLFSEFPDEAGFQSLSPAMEGMP